MIILNEVGSYCPKKFPPGSYLQTITIVVFRLFEEEHLTAPHPTLELEAQITWNRKRTKPVSVWSESSVMFAIV